VLPRLGARDRLAPVIQEGKVKTYDMGGKNTTLEAAKKVAKYAT
jgi:hypothetical protein